MTDLAGILGADRVTEAADMPVITPRDQEEVAVLLQAATRDGLALTIRGGGTKAGWRPAPDRCDALLATTALTGIVDHQPGDMTLVARAGTPIVKIQATVTSDATHRQRLMLDSVGGPAATLGGCSQRAPRALDEHAMGHHATS